MMKKNVCSMSLAVLLISGTALPIPALAELGADWRVMVVQKTDLQVWKGGAPLFELSGNFVGPSWTAAQFEADARSLIDAGNRRRFASAVTFRGIKTPPVDYSWSSYLTGDRELVVKHACMSEAEQEIMGPAFFIHPNAFLDGGSAVGTLTDGSTVKTDMPPPGIGNMGNAVRSLVLRAPTGENVDMHFDTPCVVNWHKGQLRIWTLTGTLQAGKKATVTTTISFPGKTSFRAENSVVDMADWFELKLDQDFSPKSVISMHDWLDGPAGKHGWVQIADNRFVLEKTGKPIKFWGINIATTWVAPPREGADQWADLCAKYGCNIVRFHKFARPTRIGKGGKGIMNNEDGMNIDPELAPRFDYFTAALADRGVYTGWSHLYQYRPTPADKRRLRGYDEIMAAKHGLGFLDETAYGLINYAPDVQDRVIEMTVNLLNRVNSVTGKRYAEDRSIAYIELQNEDDIFFSNPARTLSQYPTYKKWWDERFSEWLTRKYKSQEGLAKAWGNELQTGESLAVRNIDGTACSQHRAGRPTPRQLDNYLFMFEEQAGFYERYVKAIRDTGYQGALCGSCWQASGWLGHLYNVYSDRKVGFIDRHNYYKSDTPMLASPGKGLLSAGMQQVTDRPYALTEWHAGHQWDAEQIPLVTIYGNFLQGWDYLAFFASGSWHIQSGTGACNEFTKVCQYPAINMMMYRNDVKEGQPAAIRRISVEELFDDGWVGFEENFSLLGAANIKEFSSVVPRQSLAVGPVLLDFVEGKIPGKRIVDNTGPYFDQDARIVESNTGQLRWDYSGRGYFTVDTPGSQAVIGFAGPTEILGETRPKTYDLSDVTISLKTPFACLYVSSLDKAKPIAEADRLLVTAVARGEYEGTILDELSTKPVKRTNVRRYKGGPTPTQPRPHVPFLLEPVEATMTLKRNEPCRVTALDHEGRIPPTPVRIPVTRGDRAQSFGISGDYETVYYLVEVGN